MARDTQYTLYKTARTDPTFKNIWAFESEEQRDTWLNTCSPQPFLNNKYWRVGNTIKCPIRYEESFNYDYVRIVNRDADSNQRKTWFCFITGRAYISNNCTMFTLAVDFVQTFYWSKVVDGVNPFWLTEGFISKATKPLLPPRGTASEYPVPEVSCYHIDFNATGYSVVIYSSIDIRNLSTLTYTTAIIDGQYTAAPPYIMAANVSAISEIINEVNTKGYTDAIAGIYLIPNDYIDITKISTSPILATNAELFATVNKTIHKPVNCDGYIPVNKELLGYDYSYFTINNGQGEISTWHFEDFDGDPSFTARVSLASGSPVLILYPNNYINADGNDFRQLSVKITQAPSCTFLNDSYKIWLAQTQNSRAAAINMAEYEITKAKVARENSFVYKAGQLYNQAAKEIRDRGIFSLSGLTSPLKYAMDGAGIGKVVDWVGWLFSKNDSDISGGDRFGGGSSWGGGAGVDLNTMQYNYGSAISQLTNPEMMQDLAASGLAHYLGLEQYYTYDFNVANAQYKLDTLLAGYADKARVPATAAGSNAYGDVCVLQQYGFMIAVYTPTAFYAEWIDKQLNASGHVINRYSTIERHHAVFDFYSVPSPYIPAERDGRPQYARNMLISILSQGVYLWYVYQGDISDKIGVPYGIDNPEII